jgi:hypothetical protein
VSVTLSHQNHFKFGYNGEWFRLRETTQDVFTVTYGQCDTEPGSFLDESMRAARLIGTVADGPIHVLFSGGVDSEVTMLCFLAAQVPVTAAIMRFANDVNQHDIAFAVKFCQRHYIPYRFYDLDIEAFFRERLLDYTIPVRCNAPMMAATMWLIDQIDGYPVLGQGECYLLRPERRRQQRLPNAKVTSYYNVAFTDDQWALQESESVNAWYRHFLLRGRNGAPGFFQFTPQQILSYLRDPHVVSKLAELDHISNESWKLWVYQQYLDLETRPKYNGYEPIIEAIHPYRARHTRRFPHALSFVLFDYEYLLRDLSMK